MHQLMAATLDRVVERIREIQRDAREHGFHERQPWPMIVLRSPEGLDGAEGGGRSADRGHVPRAPGAAGGAVDQAGPHPDSRRVDEELPARGAIRRERRTASRKSPRLAPEGERRMGANPHANGGLLLRICSCPISAITRCRSSGPATVMAEATRVMGRLAARRDAR